MWTQAEGLRLVRAIYESSVVELPVYPALTGGLAYKKGPRKDCDIVLYHNRQHELTSQREVVRELKTIPGLRLVANHGFVTKWMYDGKPVDIMFPEWFITGRDDYDR